MTAMEMVFKGVDKGTTQTLNSIAGGFGSVITNIGNTVKASKSLLGINNIIGSLNMHRLGEIGAGIRSIGDGAAGGIREGADAVKQFEKLTGKLAFSSQIPQQVIRESLEQFKADANLTVGEATGAYEQIMSVFQTMGTKGPGNLRKLTSSLSTLNELGADWSSSANMYGDMLGAWNMDAEQAQILTANIARIGQAGGQGTQALAGMPDMFARLGDSLKTLGGSDADISAIMRSTVSLGSSFARTFNDPKAMENATMVMEGLLQKQGQLAAALGAGGEIPQELQKVSAMMNMNVNEMISNPTAMIQGMMAAAEQAGEAGNYARQTFKEFLGDNLSGWNVLGTELKSVQFGPLVTDAASAQRAIQQVQQQVGALSKTTAEQVEMMKEDYNRSLSGMIGHQGDYLRTVKKGFDSVKGMIGKYAGDQFWGKYTKAFLAFKQDGLMAGLSQLGLFNDSLGKMSAMFGGVDLAPIITAMSSMGVGVGDMLKIGAAGWALNRALKAGGSSLGTLMEHFKQAQLGGASMSDALQATLGEGFRAVMAGLPKMVSDITNSQAFRDIINAAAKMTVEGIRVGLPILAQGIGGLALAIAKEIKERLDPRNWGKAHVSSSATAGQASAGASPTIINNTSNIKPPSIAPAKSVDTSGFGLGGMSAGVVNEGGGFQVNTLAQLNASMAYLGSVFEGAMKSGIPVGVTVAVEPREFRTWLKAQNMKMMDVGN